MGTKFWSGVGVVASIVAGVGAASAADLAVKAPEVYKAPPPAYLSDWAGFYIGVHGGYGSGDTRIVDFFNGFPNNQFADLPFKPKGGLFGAHAGYNLQYGSVVAGLEIDFDGADIRDTNNQSGNFFVAPAGLAKTNELASARARLGYLVLPNLLAYGTAGAGLAHTNISFGSSIDGGLSQFGWVAGAGLEYKVWEHWIARAEYLHYDFDVGSFNLVDPVAASPQSLGRETVNVVRGGVSYKF